MKYFSIILIIYPKSNAITESTPNFQKLQLREFCDHILAKRFITTEDDNCFVEIDLYALK